MRIRRSFAWLGCVLLLGCGEPTAPLDLGPVPNVAFTTDATGYVAREFERVNGYPIYRFTIIARYENRGIASLYVDRCTPQSPSPIYGVFLVDSTKTSAFNMFWGCVGVSHLIEVPPGATKVDTFVVRGPNAFDSGSQVPLPGVLAGRYRLWYGVRLAEGERAPYAPRELQFSNDFIVTTAP